MKDSSIIPAVRFTVPFLCLLAACDVAEEPLSPVGGAALTLSKADQHEKVLFSSTRDGDSDIYVINADGSGVMNLTNNTLDDFDAKWSPNGKKIAFASWRDGNSEIYVMNADGSDPVNLTQNAASDSDPDWSHDGKQIVFHSNRDAGEEIYVMDADGIQAQPAR